MNTLLVLYLIYLSWGTVGQGRVSFLEMSRYMRLSKSGCKNMMLGIANDGLIDVIELFSTGGQKKYFCELTEKGQDYLMSNFDAAIQRYHVHVAETISIIKMRNSEGEFAPKKLNKKQLAAIAAEQRELF